jgi:deoxyhypusine synthase
MVYAEATTALPLLASYAYHKGSWMKRKKWRLARIFNTQK